MKNFKSVLSVAMLVGSVVGMSQASAGLICAGANLYTSKNIIVAQPTSVYASADACNEAVRASKNGFVCNGNILVSEDAPAPTNDAANAVPYDNAAACQKAVDSSK